MRRACLVGSRYRSRAKPSSGNLKRAESTVKATFVLIDMKGKDMSDSRKPSRKLNDHIVAEIKKRLLLREFQHNIAAEYGVNQGRISEINTGKSWAHVRPAS